jgi:nucleoside-diphosphate-sugar epimerase
LKDQAFSSFALSARSLLVPDLDLILATCAKELKKLRGEEVFFTGGTGFMGKWLLEAFYQINQTGGEPIKATILTRNPESFSREYPYLAGHVAFDLLKGDIQTITLPHTGYRWFIHLASEGVEENDLAGYEKCFSSIVHGTTNILHQAERCRNPRLLFTSTGAVYGKNPARTGKVDEDCLYAPDLREPMSVYGEGKRIAEYFCLRHGVAGNVIPIIARCFSFIGPYLAENSGQAAWSFLDAGLRNHKITIQGDGSPVRSFLYAADLTIWLIKLLVAGENGYIYNVGSESPVSILQFASEISSALPEPADVQILGRPNGGLGSNIYLPDTSKIREAINVDEYTPRDVAIKKTLAYMRELNRNRQV